MTSRADFQAQFVSALSGKTTNAFRLFGNLVDIVRDTFVKYGCEHRAEIIAGAKGAYDELAHKIDIPLFAEPLESEWEQQLWAVHFGPGLEYVADLCCGKVIE